MTAESSCTSCGAPVAGMRFCTRCGTPVRSAHQPPVAGAPEPVASGLPQRNAAPEGGLSSLLPRRGQGGQGGPAGSVAAAARDDYDQPPTDAMAVAGDGADDGADQSGELPPLVGRATRTPGASLPPQLRRTPDEADHGSGSFGMAPSGGGESGGNPFGLTARPQQDPIELASTGNSLFVSKRPRTDEPGQDEPAPSGQPSGPLPSLPKLPRFGEAGADPAGRTPEQPQAPRDDDRPDRFERPEIAQLRAFSERMTQRPAPEAPAEPAAAPEAPAARAAETNGLPIRDAEPVLPQRSAEPAMPPPPVQPPMPEQHQAPDVESTRARPTADPQWSMPGDPEATQVAMPQRPERQDPDATMVAMPPPPPAPTNDPEATMVAPMSFDDIYADSSSWQPPQQDQHSSAHDSDGAPTELNQFGASQFAVPDAQASTGSTTGYEQTGFEQTGFERPAYEQQGYDQQGFGQQGFGQDGYDQPGYDQQQGYDSAYGESLYAPYEAQQPAQPAEGQYVPEQQYDGAYDNLFADSFYSPEATMVAQQPIGPDTPPPPPMAPPAGGFDGYESYDAFYQPQQQPKRGLAGMDTKRWAIVGATAAAVVAIIAFAIGMTSGGDDGAQTATDGSKTTGATAQQASENTDSAKGQAEAIQKLMKASSKDKAAIGGAASDLQQCKNVDQAIQTFKDAAASRSKLVSQIGDLDTSALPTADKVVDNLKEAWTKAGQADSAYAAWGKAMNHECKGGKKKLNKATRLSIESHEPKQRAAKAWNPIAKKYDLDTVKYTQL